MKNRSRSLALSLVLTLLVAGCASVGNNFDESKIAEIKKGVTTEGDLVKMFGDPQNRTINSDSGLILTWMYSEAKVKGQSFIPYAGAFMGGTKAKNKTLSATLTNDVVASYTFSGGGTETRNMTQDTPKN